MQLKDYNIREKLFSGKRFTIYRAVEITKNTSRILKVLDKQASIDVKNIDALEHEYDLLKQFDSEYIIKTYDRFDHEHYAGIVLEDIDGQSIKNHIKKSPFSIEEFSKLAVRITTGLAAVHAQNIIHRDINPTNIIWNSKTNSLKIIDFNISSKFDIKVLFHSNPEKLQGTLPYISPEQSGRLNRRVDQRSDLYSLGATFYEMLTGKLPFENRDPMEIVYAHLAKIPASPHLINEKVPLILANIILRLLAKNPEERYQSAEGLKHDLEKAAKLNFEDFKLAEKDFSGKLQVPEKLYGREKEIQQLLDAYKKVSGGARGMILVAGYSGTGKTSLVNEIHVPITENHGHFISGKFDQLQRTMPYFAFTQALNQFCRLLLTEKSETLAGWKKSILQAVGVLGKVLTDIIPALEHIIGKQPEVPEVGGDEARIRFNYVFQRFLHAISTKEHPLVLFLDDLQWADLASLNLLQVLMEDTQNRYLLFIGAYRDNEVSPTHPLMMTVENIRQKDIDVLTISVKNLSLENVQKWLKDTLKTENKPEALKLADLIYQKTQGNAFFTTQFLENLHKNNLLSFDFKQSKWAYDIAEIKRQNISDNVVDLLVRKIKTFAAGVQDVLKLASCIGNVFDLNVLSVISGKGKEEHYKHLEIPLAEHLVYPAEKESYKFVHDRIHQAAYSLIAEKDKPPLHLKIGRLLLDEFESSRGESDSHETEQQIFDIVNHLNIGIELIEADNEKLRLARFNLKAAEKARASAAYKSGFDYVGTAIGLLPGDYWHNHYDLALSVFKEAIQLSYLSGNYEEMEHFIEIALTFAKDISHKSVAYECRILGLIRQSKDDLGAKTLLNIFDTLGVNIPIGLDQDQINRILNDTQGRLKQKGIASLIDLPLMTNPQKLLVARLFHIGSGAIVYGAPELVPILGSRLVDLILDYGLAPETPYILSYYGFMRLLFGDITGAYQLGEISTELIDKKINDEGVMVRAMVLICVYLIVNKQHYKKACKMLIDTYPHALNVGDLEYAGYILTNYIQLLSHTDCELHILKEKALKYKDKMIQLKQSVLLATLSVEIAFNSNLLGEKSNPASLDIDLDTISKNVQAGGTIVCECLAGSKRILLSILFEEYKNVLKHIKDLQDSFVKLTFPISHVRSDFHFVIPLAYLQLYTGTESKKDKETYLNVVKESMKTVKEWADFGPVNFLHKYYLMQAELYRVTGKNQEAAEYYDKAIEKAYENEYVNEAAIANELAAKFYIQQNRSKLATLYMIEARDCYRKWGAIAKIKHLEENYPKYLSMGMPGAKLSSPGTISSSSTETTGELLDVKSIIKASQTLSGEVQLENLLEKMMQILIENAGAQKGLFIEKSGESLLVQAEGTKDAVSGILAALPVEESDKLPHSVINYVARSKKKLVFDNISKDATYSADKYMQEQQIKSVVCFPILRQDELSAIIYLENNLVEGAFTPERVEVLNTLSSQIAISMENARIYRDLEELNLSLEQKVAERTKQLEDMDKIKSRFFANISHEFRTPLTLIMGPLEQRLTESRDKSHVEEMQMMLRNSRRLLTLINQLLDLSKLESGRMILQAAEQDVIPFLKGVVGSFESLAEQKEVDLALQTEQENISLYYDAEKLEKIVVNLVANAMKFTPAGGKVTVTAAEYTPGKDETKQKFCGGPGGGFSKESPGFHSPPTWWARRQEGCLIIKVCDTGKGISEDQLPYVFDRFYQAGSATDRQKRGTGIGLALVKELVELHHGDVFVQSTEGKGSEFTVCLPLGKEHLEPEEIGTETKTAVGDPTTWAGDENQGGFFEKSPPSPPPKTSIDLEGEEAVDERKPLPVQDDGSPESEKDVILIVEDNPDVRKFIRGPLEPLYKVVEAENGRVGIEKAKKIIPDLIVSDIMMPEVDGYELCDTLKKDKQTSHIPIVMLTAKASDKSMIQGLETGADDYLTKPFNTKILLTRIKNLIDLRRGLQEKIQREMVLQPTEIAVSSVDQEFIKELKEAIEKNLSDEEFNVDKLAQAMLMGRATLNRKIRAITGESTNQFIQSYRLKRAAQLLKAKFGNVTEVSFEVGFSSSAYFTKCFREKFHQPPNTYLAAEAE